MPLDLKARFADHAEFEIYPFLIADYWHRCDSPIERLMLAELLGAQNLAAGLRCRVADGDDLEAEKARIKESPEYVGTWIHIMPQARFGRRRTDFVVMLSDDRNNGWPLDQRLCRVAAVVVECDGRDFHQDEEKERQRDQEIQRHGGIPIFHVEGWKIVHRPGHSRQDVLLTLCDRLWPDTHLRYSITQEPYYWHPPEDDPEADEPYDAPRYGDLVEKLEPIPNRMARGNGQSWFEFCLQDPGAMDTYHLWNAANWVNHAFNEFQGGVE